MNDANPLFRREPPKAAGTDAVAPGKGATAQRTDGRVKRSIVTRKKIVDALAALVLEGQLAPTAQQVALRADVGLRTVFRHFDDMDALYREITSNVNEQVQPLLLARLDGATWQERVLQSIDHRSAIYDRTAAMHLAAQVHRHESAFLAQNLMDSAALQRELLRRLLPEKVAQIAPLLDALDLALSFEAWIRLRREQGLPANQAREVIRLAVRALLATVAQPVEPASPA
jgi:AcrR family transcriptional regulator